MKEHFKLLILAILSIGFILFLLGCVLFGKNNLDNNVTHKDASKEYKYYTQSTQGSILPSKAKKMTTTTTTTTTKKTVISSTIPTQYSGIPRTAATIRHTTAHTKRITTKKPTTTTKKTTQTFKITGGTDESGNMWSPAY